jgi:hypothetical protein
MTLVKWELMADAIVSWFLFLSLLFALLASITAKLILWRCVDCLGAMKLGPKPDGRWRINHAGVTQRQLSPDQGFEICYMCSKNQKPPERHRARLRPWASKQVGKLGLDAAMLGQALGHDELRHQPSTARSDNHSR